VNLYFRLLWIVLKAIWGKKKSILDPSCLSLHALPLDCDLNWHVNNARYLSFMDLGRIHLMGQAGLYSILLKRRWSPVLVAAEISFIRAIRPMQKFKLDTRIVSWDDNYLYLEQSFKSHGRLLALAYVKGVFLAQGKKLPTQDILQLSGIDSQAPPPMPEPIQHWQQMLEAKKR
jgi:acyl-CoA thioesterase FadM